MDIERLRALEKKWRDDIGTGTSYDIYNEAGNARRECADELATLIAELGQEVEAVADAWIDIPKAQALIAAVGPGYRVIYRDAFRWKDENGHVLPNHYEMFSAPGLCADFGHELILDLGNAAILRDKRTSPAHTSEARDAALVDELVQASQAVQMARALTSLPLKNEFAKRNGMASYHEVEAWMLNAHRRFDAAIAAMRQEGGTP